MADFRRRTWIMRSRPSVTPRVIDDEITPSSGWTDNPDFHFLLVDLPGFEKDDIKFNVNESGIIVISGRKRIGEEKQVHFEKRFNVPENGDVKNINMTFEGDSLKVIIPKVEKEKKHTPENMNGSASSANKEEKKEAMAFLSSNNEDEKEKEKLESPGLTRDTKQESEGKKEAMAFPSSNDDEKEKDKLESPGLTSDTKQESKTPSSDDDDKEKEKEEVKKPDLGADTTEEKKDIHEHEERKEELENRKEEESRENLSERQKEQNDGEGERSPGPREEVAEKTVIVKIIENKGIFLASIISFTLGVLFSQRFHAPSPK